MTFVSTHSTRYQAFERKRQLLATLIRVAKDISGHTHSLSDALLLARPSQKYPAKVQQYKKQVDRYLLLLKEPDLKIRSENYDQQSSILLDALMEFIGIAEQQTEEDQEPELFSNEMRLQLQEFGGITQVAIVLRLLLQDMGIILPPVKYSVPQEWIGEQISQLNDTNHHLRLKATDKVAELILEVIEIQKAGHLSRHMKDTLEFVHDALTENLEHLEHGGNIERLPYEFEALELTSIPDETVSQFIETKHSNEIPILVEESDHKMKFNEKLKMWLNTSWQTRWRDLD